MKQFVWTPPTQPSHRRAEVVPLPGRADRRLRRHADRRLAHGYTGELGYEVFCHPDDGPAVWDAIWEAGAPHGLKPLGLEALDMIRIEVGPDLRRLRVRRPGRPVRGGHRLRRQARLRGRLRRQGGADRALPAPAARAGRPGAGRQRDRRPRRRGVGRPPARRASSRAARAARRCARTSRSAGWRSSTRSSAPRSRSASSTACRSASPPGRPLPVLRPREDQRPRS